MIITQLWKPQNYTNKFQNHFSIGDRWIPEWPDSNNLIIMGWRQGKLPYDQLTVNNWLLVKLDCHKFCWVWFVTDDNMFLYFSYNLTRWNSQRVPNNINNSKENGSWNRVIGLTIALLLNLLKLLIFKIYTINKYLSVITTFLFTRFKLYLDSMQQHDQKLDYLPTMLYRITQNPYHCKFFIFVTEFYYSYPGTVTTTELHTQKMDSVLYCRTG